MKNEAGIATCNSGLLKLSKVQRSVLLRDSGETIHMVQVTVSDIYEQKPRTLTYVCVFIQVLVSASEKAIVKSRKDHKSHKPGIKSKKYIPPTPPPAPPH